MVSQNVLKASYKQWDIFCICRRGDHDPGVPLDSTMNSINNPSKLIYNVPALHYSLFHADLI